MTTPGQPSVSSRDEETTRRIVDELDTNFIVEAGAGAGKTYAMVSRVVALVKAGPDHGGASMDQIVAITFTEAAAAELSQRIRSRMEQLLDADHPDNLHDVLHPLTVDEQARVRQAVDDIDQASIQTIHSFLGQLLRERPMDVGLPPGWLQLDAQAATQRFNEKWDRWLEWALGGGPDAPQRLQTLLTYLVGDRVGLSRWRQYARAVERNYSKMRSTHSVPDVNLRQSVLDALTIIQSLTQECADESDRLHQHMAAALDTMRAVELVADDPVAAARTLKDGPRVVTPRNVGRRDNWNLDVKTVQDASADTGLSLEQDVLAAPLIAMVDHLRQEFALNYESERKTDGVATFDDLLVWGRDLLLNDAARAHFQNRYTRILIDEFQDTDPLQAEVAFYLASTPDADVADHSWHNLPLAPGRLFLVGDSKQSIYRFRGADVTVTEKVKTGGWLQVLTLTQNRRSQQPILDWVNRTFSQLMVADDFDVPGVQAQYLPLAPHDAIQQPGLGTVIAFGGMAPEDADLPRLPARHIASLIINHTVGGNQPLAVCDASTRQPRPAGLRDVCILLRDRTGLSALQWELENANVPYRIEGGSLLFDTQEVQDLLNCLQAIDDPTDEISVVAALRSTAFACSDVDLLHWADAGGPWDCMSPNFDPSAPPESDGHRPALASIPTIWAAMAVLRAYHLRRQSISVPQLISEFVRERRLEELDLTEYRAREKWQRRQFLISQARDAPAVGADTTGHSAWNLHQFLRWVEQQREESARIAESPVPDTDDDAVRIMTMHGSKGLEFPIVILQNLAIADRDREPETVLFNDRTGTLELYVRRTPRTQTPGYTEVYDEAVQHARAEKIRLAYVAATRARDHLFVSLYHRWSEDEPADPADARQPTNGDRAAAMVGLPAGLPHATVPVFLGPAAQYVPAQPDALAQPVEPYDPDAWQSDRSRAINQRSLPQSVTATWLAQQGANRSDVISDPDGRPVSPPIDDRMDDKEAEPDAEQPWRKGRGGTAFGSAVHAVLQDVVTLLKPRLPLPPDCNSDDLVVELHPDLFRLAQLHSAAEGLPERRDEVVALVSRALQNPDLLTALQAPRQWPELPVAAPIDTARGPVVIQGFIDLLYEDVEGQVVIIDYKSDDVRNADEVRSRMDHYRYQGAAYAAAVQNATGKSVRAVQFLFLRIDEMQTVDNLPLLLAELPNLIDNPAI